MSTSALHALFYPKQVAIYAEAGGKDTYGWRLVETLLRHNYNGQIWRMTSRPTAVCGIPAFPALPFSAEPDAAVIAAPLDATFAAIDECGRRGVRVAVVATIGFAEAGPHGAALQAQLRNRAAAWGLRILGPNCLGALNTSNGVTLCNSAALLRTPMLQGPISLFSQSGSLLSSILSAGQERGIGFRYLAATGNECDLALDDFIAFALEDPGTTVIATVIEHIRHPQRFLELADRAAQLGKPIVVLKIGRSPAAVRVARSHTAALTGDDAAQDAVFRRYGITRLHSPEELVQTAAVLAQTVRPAGRRTAIVAPSGGVCGMLADLAAEAQLELAPIQLQPPEQLLALYGEQLDNPLDLGRTRPGIAPKTPSVVRQLAEGLDEHPSVDLVLFGLSAMADLEPTMRQLVEGLKRKPLVVYSAVSGEWAEGVKSFLRASGIFPVDGARPAVQAARALIGYAHFLRTYTPPRPVARATVERKPGLLNEVASRTLLASAGLPIPPIHMAQSPHAAVEVAAAVGFPIAMKLVAADLPHRTEIGGVLLNVASREVALAGYEELLQRARAANLQAVIEGVLIQPMVQGVEMILGSYVDPQFGPILLLGVGGVFAELFRDTALAVPPLTPTEAYQLIAQLRGKALLDGVRGLPPADIEGLVQLVVQFSEVIAALGDTVRSIDLNPVVVLPRGQGVYIADVLVEMA